MIQNLEDDDEDLELEDDEEEDDEDLEAEIDEDLEATLAFDVARCAKCGREQSVSASMPQDEIQAFFEGLGWTWTGHDWLCPFETAGKNQ